MAPGGGGKAGMSLREAASVVFGLVAVLPILLFVYLLSRADLLGRIDVQIGLALAVVVAALGFFVFQTMVGQIAKLAEGLTSPALPATASADGTRLLPPVPGLGPVVEIDKVSGALQQMLEELNGATGRLEDLVFKLGTLNQTVDLAARIPGIQDLLGQVLETTMRAVRASSGSIMILDRERRVLRLVASHGVADEVSFPDEVDAAEGIAGEVVERGHPVVAENVEADPRFREPGAPRRGGDGSLICMPIRAAERVIGVINMARRRVPDGAPTEPFTGVDLQFLNALMTYIGYAADNARLLEEGRRAAERLQCVAEDLKATREQLVRGETLRAVGQLSSGMAHHLNNLFAVILGRSELLLGSAETGARRSLEIIQRAAQDGADVTRRVQRFGRRHPITEPVAVDLNQLARDVVKHTRPRWQDEEHRSGRRIDIEVEPGLVPPVAGELASLQEVLVNLLVNGVEAMPDGGEIRIRTWVDGDRVRCAVGDTGIGMTEDVRRRALEPFYTTKGPKRTGLGLSVAYGAVQRCGGTLEIASRPGQGTIVTISLPVAQGAVAERGEAAPSAAPRLRILVIDDEAEARDELGRILESQGHSVLKAAAGAEGLERLRAGDPFDLVLTDLGMPGMNGWEIAQALERSWPRLAVGLITDWSEQAMTREERSRVDFVIPKPFDPEQVRETLAALPARA